MVVDRLSVQCFGNQEAALNVLAGESQGSFTDRRINNAKVGVLDPVHLWTETVLRLS